MSSTVVGLGQWWRARRRPVIFGVAITALFVVLVTLIYIRQPPDGAVLGTENPGPDGAQAVARVLSENGVTVENAGSLDEVDQLLETHPNARVLLYDEGYLADERIEQVAEVIPPGQRVLVDPSDQLLDVLADGVSRGAPIDADTVLTAECESELAQEAETITGSGTGLISDSGCFPVDTEAGPQYGLVEDNRGTQVVGQYGIFTNQSVGQEGNAVVALWSSSDTVIWYLPTSADLLTDESQAPIMPDWIQPAIWWLVIVAVFVLIWAGRRHGPVIAEPLPVDVSALESTVGRARMYERAGQYNAALATLQHATRRRLARQLGADAESVVHRVNELLAKDVSELFSEPDAINRTQLVVRAKELQQLEHDVHQQQTGRNR